MTAFLVDQLFTLFLTGHKQTF